MVGQERRSRSRSGCEVVVLIWCYDDEVMLCCGCRIDSSDERYEVRGIYDHYQVNDDGG